MRKGKPKARGLHSLPQCLSQWRSCSSRVTLAKRALRSAWSKDSLSTTPRRVRTTCRLPPWGILRLPPPAMLGPAPPREHTPPQTHTQVHAHTCHTHHTCAHTNTRTPTPTHTSREAHVRLHTLPATHTLSKQPSVSGRGYVFLFCRILFFPEILASLCSCPGFISKETLVCSFAS